MRKRYQITEEQIGEIKRERIKNKNKNIEKRLKTLLLHAEGKSRKEISEQTGFVVSYISELVSKYCNGGMDAIIENKYKGNRRNISFVEEEEFLSEYKELAEKGQIIDTIEIKRAYEEKVGHEIGSSQIYRVLKRHGWRKVMPRSKHPNKATEEEIDSSKKLTIVSEKSWKILPQKMLD